MRQEQDSLGEVRLSDEEYFGISTARLLAVADSFGPRIPQRLAKNIVRVRQAQALALGRSGAWNEQVAESVVAAAERLVADEDFFAAQLRICALHGGGARSLVVNIDEVLANVALQLQRKSMGEYHWFAPLLRLDIGFATQQVCLIALHISLVQLLEEFVAKIVEAESLLRLHMQDFAGQPTVSQMDFQDVKISDMSSEFACCANGLDRVRRQLAWYRTELLRLWCETPEVIRCLQELVGVECCYDEVGRDSPVGMDLYEGLSGLLKTAASLLLNFCNELRKNGCVSKALELPKRCTSSVFNPAGQDVVALNTISQIAFHIIGSDATLTAALNGGMNGVVRCFPLISTCLIDSLQQLTVAVQVLSDSCLTGLRGNAEVGLAAVERTPLLAEKLIPLIGYERAVQVARIAALTEKPVHTVVVRMKLLSEEQAASLFFHTPGTVNNEE